MTEKKTEIPADIKKMSFEEALEELKDTAWMLEGRVAPYVTVGATLIIPRLLIVLLTRRVEPGKEPVLEIESSTHDERSVGVEPDILVVLQVVLEDVSDEPAQDGDVGSGTDLEVLIGDGGRTREARIDRHELGAAPVPGLNGPFESTGVVLGWIGTHH